jgi:hypothetical protein
VITLRVACAALFLVPLLLSPADAALPERVFLKTKTQSFTHEWYLALESGALWIKSVDASQGNGKWNRIGEIDDSGVLPAGTSLTEISADGDNLIAVSKKRQVYYAKLSTLEWNRGRADLKWKDVFGRPKYLLGRAQKLRAPTDVRALAVSHRGDYIGGYEDIDENFHFQSAGVTTLYLLSADGLRIRYTDPWIRAHFNRAMNLPEAGEKRFRAVSLSASASTLFILNEAGEMHTRLADFDTLGENPALKYSFTRSHNPLKRSNGAWNEVRSLPGEWWREQPPIVGRITDLITIAQSKDDGRTAANARRELRVEGQEAGKTGYYSKPILLNNPLTGTPYRWRFVETGQPIQGRFIHNGQPETVPSAVLWGPRLGSDYQAGKLTSERLGATTFSASLLGFHPKSRRAKIAFHFAEGDIELSLYSYRLDDYAPSGKILAVIVRPPSYSPYNPVLRRRLDSVFADKTHVFVELRSQQGGKHVSIVPQRREGMKAFEISFSRD